MYTMVLGCTINLFDGYDPADYGLKLRFGDCQPTLGRDRVFYGSVAWWGNASVGRRDLARRDLSSVDGLKGRLGGVYPWLEIRRIYSLPWA